MSGFADLGFFGEGEIPLSGLNGIVTGASRGIGRAVALALGREGMRLAVNYTSPSSTGLAEDVCAQIRTTGGEAIPVQADIGNAADRARLLSAAREAFGPVHLLVNNAGITRIHDVLDEPDADADTVMAVNWTGTRALTRDAATAMIQSNVKGCIIYVLSISTLLASDNRAAYCESKAALEMNMKIHAGRLLEHGIKVNGVSVGVTATDLTRARLETYRQAADLGYLTMYRAGTPEDIARAVLYAIRCYDTGAVIPANGGILLPTLNLRSMKALTPGG